MPVCFDMLLNYTTDDAGTKSVVIKTSSNEKMHMTVILIDSTKLP
jgi:hypothetical protein